MLPAIMIRFKPTDLIILLVAVYFFMGHIVQIHEVRDLISVLPFFNLGILAASIFYLLLRSAKSKRHGLFDKRLNLFCLYLMIAFIILSIINLNAVRPAYSISRSMTALLILAASVILFWQFFQVTDRRGLYGRNLLTYSLGSVLVLAVIGQLTIPSWAAGIGGVRMSGGSNPNQVAFFAFFTIFWVHYITFKVGKWKQINASIYVIATVVLLWSLSRSVILTWIVMYSVYFAGLLYIHFIRAIRGWIKKQFLYRSLITTMTIAIFVVAIPFVLEVTDMFLQLEIIERRLSGGGGLESRIRGWEIIWPFFWESPMTGGAGWWYSTQIMTIHSTPGVQATSPHNLFVRLLTEVGIAGFIIVLAFPFFILCSLFKKLILESTNHRKFALHTFLIASIFSVFIGQFFEDRYMVGIGGVGNAIIVFILVCGLKESLSK